jgi:hypothetical protein
VGRDGEAEEGIVGRGHRGKREKEEVGGRE